MDEITLKICDIVDIGDNNDQIFKSNGWIYDTSIDGIDLNNENE